MPRYGLLVSCKVIAFIPLLFVVPLVAKELQLTSAKFIFDRWMKIHVDLIFVNLVVNELQYNCMELHVFLYVYGAKYNKFQLMRLVQ
jgi:hypothetical protein